MSPAAAGAEDRRLRAAARLALAVAVEGERADERIEAPAALRRLLGFSRLSATSHRAIAKVIDEDGIFRARVADAAPDESVVGRVGWLWLHRPVGWQDEVWPDGSDRGGGTSGGDEPGAVGGRPDRDDKLRRAAKDADAARRRIEAELKEVRREARALERSLAEQRAEVERMEGERAAARRDAKAAEAALGAARRDLKVARSAARDAELELQQVRAAMGESDPTNEGPDDGGDRARLVAAVSELVAQARTIEAQARSLGEVARSLQPAGDASDPSERSVGATASDVEVTSAVGRGAGTSKRRGRRVARLMPSLPPGVFDGTAEAHRHLLADGANLVVVDGYNVARTGWSELPLDEERWRVVALLEAVQARSGAAVVVVFDGDHDVVSPAASRTVRVRYSPAGTTADEVIAELVDATAASRPIVVVSSDREVSSHARSRGAAAIGSAAFLAAARR